MNFFKTTGSKVALLAALFIVGILSFQNCSNFKASEATGSSDSLIPGFGKNATGVTKISCTVGDSSTTESFRSENQKRSNSLMGKVVVPYAMFDGSSSGTCTYDAGGGGAAEAGTVFTLEGKCTNSAGQTFDSSGAMSVSDASYPPAVYSLLASFGRTGGGNMEVIYLHARVNLADGSVSDIDASGPVLGNDPNSKYQTSGSCASGSGGSTSVPSPYKVRSSSNVWTWNLSDGSSCSVVANPWGAGFSVVASCTSSAGVKFSLVGDAAVSAADRSAYFYRLIGTGPDPQPSNGGISWVIFGDMYPDGRTKNSNGNISTTSGYGAAVVKPVYVVSATQPMPPNSVTPPVVVQTTASTTNVYRMTFYVGSAVGGDCDLDAPNGAGIIIGRCIVNGSYMPIKSTAIVKMDDNNYRVDFSQDANPVVYKATLTFSVKDNAGRGTWSSPTGGGDIVVVRTGH